MKKNKSLVFYKVALPDWPLFNPIFYEVSLRMLLLKLQQVEASDHVPSPLAKTNPLRNEYPVWE